MGKYEKLASEIVKNVGGSHNILSVTHCFTRLRFDLKDESKANDEAVKSMKGVVSLMKSGGQYQVVIGNHVSEVYEDLCAVAGIEITSNPSLKSEKKKSVGAVIQDYMSAIMNPTLGLLCASGMIQGINAIISMMGIMDSSHGLYQLLEATGNALFHFFPIFLGYTAAVKFGMKPFLGMGIGAALVFPDIQNMAETTLFGLDINGISYTSTVIPIILIIMLAAPVERWFNKVLPSVVKGFLTPMLVLMLFVPLGYVFIGELANALSNGINVGMMEIANFSPILAGFLIAGLWQVLVIFGIHGGLIMIMIMDIIQGNANELFTHVAAHGFAVSAVLLAIWFKTKDKELKSMTAPAFISSLFGITEPAIYGITLPRLRVFFISLIGSALGGTYFGITRVATYRLSGMGVFRIPGVIDPTGSNYNLINFLIGNGITIAFSFVATYLLFKDEVVESEAKEKTSITVTSNAIEKINSPLTGTVIPLSTVEDQAFSQKILGDGIAIKPTIGQVLAPADGTLTTLFPTNHALGITTEEGIEILIHVGMDTVQLGGKYFNVKVAQHDKIKKGQLLLEFDIEKIEAAGYSTITPIIITNTTEFSDVIETDESNINFNQTLLSVVK